MNTKSRRWSDVASGLGFVMALFGAWLLIYRDGYGSLAWPLLALGCIVMFVGFWFYVRAKGYPPVWSLLFFLVGPPLFFVFFFLPDRESQNASRT